MYFAGVVPCGIDKNFLPASGLDSEKKNLPWNHGEDALARFDPAKYFDDVSIFNASELPDRGIGVLRAMPCPEMR